MYVTAPNECFALDAGTGRQIWHFKRPRTKGVVRRRREPRRRGRRRSRVHGDRQRAPASRSTASPASCCGTPSSPTGARTTRPRRRRCRRATWSSPASPAASTAPTGSSPRTIRRPARKSGASGPCRSRASRDRRRGRARTSSTAARRPGSPAATIPELDLVYWPTGNPSKEYNGDDRKGDNLYANCILALDRKTGTLKWYYQFTPHDLWDWDATQTSVLVDADWEGQPRKLMLHANRNGFFYVFDRARRQAAAGEAVRQAT